MITLKSSLQFCMTIMDVGEMSESIITLYIYVYVMYSKITLCSYFTSLYIYSLVAAHYIICSIKHQRLK